MLIFHCQDMIIFITDRCKESKLLICTSANPVANECEARYWDNVGLYKLEVPVKLKIMI